MKLPPRSIFLVGFLGMPVGALFALLLSTVQIWLAQEDINKTLIGLFTLCTLPNAIKFLWAPVLDHVKPPFFLKHLGQRRGWALLVEFMLFIGLFLLSTCKPAQDFQELMISAIFVGFLGSCHEIIIDAYRIEVLGPKNQALGSSSNVVGYRIGQILGGAGSLYIATYFGWPWVFRAIACLMALAFLLLLLSPEPPPSNRSKVQADRAVARAFCINLGLPKGLCLIGEHLYATLIGPFKEFRRWTDWLIILMLVLFLRLGDALNMNMGNVFFLDTGFSAINIGDVTKIFGVGASITGGLIGGIISMRLGPLRGLFFCSSIHALFNGLMVVLATAGNSLPVFYTVVALEFTTGGMTTAAFVTFLQILCHPPYTGTQYALLSSLWYLSSNLGAAGGWIAEHLDSWICYFLLTWCLSFPGPLLCGWLIKKGKGTLRLRETKDST